MESSPNMIFFLKDFELNAVLTGYFVYNKIQKQFCGISGLGDISAIICLSLSWQREFDPWDPHHGKGEPTPESAPLTSIYECVRYVHTHRQANVNF